MEMTLDWHDKPNDYVMIRDCESWVDEVYTDYRNRGLERPTALQQTALDLNISVRKARSFLEGYGGPILIERYQEMRRLYLTHLDAEAEFAMKRAADRLKRKREMDQERRDLREMRR